MRDWVLYFLRNRAERQPVPWELGVTVEERLRDPLIRSLQRFQVGESGDGAHLRRGAARTGDVPYTAALTLFVEEEKEHAQWLAGVLHALGAGLLTSHWSDTCFVALRRCFGLHQELLVLLIAEMIAMRYYRALYDATDDPVLRAVFGQILRDERGHVAFHTDYLGRAFADLPAFGRFVVRAGWQTLFLAACLVVAWDHRGVLRACGVPAATFLADCGGIFRGVATGIFPKTRVTEAV